MSLWLAIAVGLAFPLAASWARIGAHGRTRDWLGFVVSPALAAGLTAMMAPEATALILALWVIAAQAGSLMLVEAAFLRVVGVPLQRLMMPPFRGENVGDYWVFSSWFFGSGVVGIATLAKHS